LRILSRRQRFRSGREPSDRLDGPSRQPAARARGAAQRRKLILGAYPAALAARRSFEDYILRAFPEDFAAHLGEMLLAAYYGEEVVARKLAHFAGEEAATI